MTRTARALHAVMAPLQRWGAVTRIGAAGAGATSVLAVAAWAARFGWVDGGLWVLAAWSGAIAALVLGTWSLLRLGRVGAPAGARWFEARAEWRAGRLTATLRAPSAGTSPELFAAADERTAALVAAAGPALLAAPTDRTRRRSLGAVALLVLGAVGLLAARPATGRPALLWDPNAAWRAATAPIQLAGPDSTVERGSRVRLAITAHGRRIAQLWLRAPGESWRGIPVLLDSTGSGSYETPPLESDLYARSTVGGRSSDTLAIAVRIPAFVGSVVVEAEYPAYLGLESEPLPLDGDTVLLPLGTRLLTRGEATTELRSAGWIGEGATTALAVEGRGFHGVVTPRISGALRLVLRTQDGAPLAGDSVTLPIRVVADSAPVVELPVPGSDTVLPIDLRLPIVIEARDDHGLARLQVESRRIPQQGTPDPPHLENTELPPGHPDHAVVPYTLDLSDRGLIPGDTVRVIVRAWDAAPAPHLGSSREYVFRLPRADEVRAAAREASREIARQLDSSVSASRHLERTTQDLARERARAEAASQGRSADEALDFEAAQRAAEVARAQQATVDQAQQLHDRIEALQRAAEAAGASDPEWQRQLDDIRRQLDRALTPELQQKLDQLQRALHDLDADRTREALQQLQPDQQELRETLERARELFRRAAIEGDLANAEAEARDLRAAQQQWDQRPAGGDSTRAGRIEDQLATRADSLGASLDRLGDQLRSEGREQALDRSAEQARDAADRMRSAAQAARSGQRQESAEQGQAAEQQLSQLPEDLDQQRDQVQQQWRDEVATQLDAAMQETARLTESELQVAEGFRRGEGAASLRQEQGAVTEGVERVLETLREAAGKNALVSPQLAMNLGTAQRQMQQARDALEPATPNFREGAERAEAAVDALNAVSHQLMQSRGDVGQAQSGSGMQEAMERMSRLAQQQQSVGQGALSLLPTPGQGRGDGQMQSLAAQQRAIAEQLERLRAGGQIPGAGEFSIEARDLARQLDAGRLDRSMVERQERLFRRMLDAGRTLQGEEQDEQKERQSTSANGDSVRLPPALRSRLSDASGRLRMPSWEELQRFAPEERRLVVEYFRRLGEQP